MQGDINVSQAGLEKLRISEAAMHNLVVIQEPFVSPRPIETNKVWKIVDAGTAGLIVGLFSVFLIEYWEKSLAR